MGHGEHDDEPPDEGHDDEPATRGAPPDPMDRLWVHPTELPALTTGFAPARPGVRRARFWLGPIAAGAAGALITVAILAIAGAFDRNSSPPVSTAPTPRAATGSPSAIEAAAHTGLSVVAVAAHDNAGTRRGSGVCVRHAGEVLTAAHLVGNATEADVFTSDGQRHRARVIGRDRSTDLVLLKIETDADVPAADLADATVGTGSSVWIVGAPTPGTTSLWVSAGMLATNDAIVWSHEGPTMAGLLETDAVAGASAIGGALIDRDGAVVGIALGRIDGSDTSYAVPISAAVAIAEQLRAHGVAQHGSAGFGLADGTGGPTITQVTANGAADRAGLHVGDVVESVDGRGVDSMSDVQAIVREHSPGSKLTLELTRAGSDFTSDLVLTAMNG